MTTDALDDHLAGQERTELPETCSDAAAQRGLAGLRDWLTARALFVVAVCAVIIISLLGIPTHLAQDGWLALIAGRLVASHGVPTHDYFAWMTYGQRWVDQQWLAQWVMFELVRLGGLQLMTVFYVLVTGVAFGGAVAAGRSLGGEDLDVLKITLPGVFFYLVTAVSIRTQGFAYPLFVATLWLLASDWRSRERGQRVYLVLPILVLWGNLHGSATMGAGLGGLYGLLLLARGLRDRGLAALRDARAWAFVLISPLTLLATPYGMGMVHYYRVTLLNPQFSRLVTEWKPITTVPILAVPLFVMIAGAILAVLVTVVRARSSAAAAPPLYDVLVLLILAAGAVIAVRNVTWFGLALVILLPHVVTQMRAGRAAPLRRSRRNFLAAGATLVLCGLVTLVVLMRPSGWFTSTYPRRAITTLSTLIAQDPHAKILADVRYADWLIWERPALFSGRVAYDTSFELLSKRQLEAIGDLAANTRNARTTVASYPIWMLYPGNRAVNRKLLRRPGARLISKSRKVIIATYHMS
ncbi:MAG: hypothetical protein M0T77_07010 [Actinomycetota bacterium]|nr:hypothetical protein [Actinomycetota bacterium]